MHVEIPLGFVFTFLGVWARIAGLFSFLPVPGLKSPVDPPRLLMGLILAFCLMPDWHAAALAKAPISGLLLLILHEAVFGVCTSLVVNLIFEAFQFGAQVLAQQAGFSYASTIDPTNDTDSGVLLILCQLLCGFFSISMGLDRQLIAIVAGSLVTIPPGSFAASWQSFDQVTRLGGLMFETGLRLALPAVAVFLALDILLAILSRLEQQLQLTAILFPAKTAGAILVTASLVAGFPQAFETMVRVCLDHVRTAVGGG